MDKQIENSLIANSGLHFKTTYLDINPEEPLMLPDGRTLKYSFLEMFDFINNRVRFDVCASKDGFYVPANYLVNNNLCEMAPNGTIVLDKGGVPKIKEDTVLAVVENYQSNDPAIMSINSLSSYRVKSGVESKSAFDMLLGKWLPMPMYELDVSGQSTGFPSGWCRVRIDEVGGKKKDGSKQYRFVWGFDTSLARDIAEAELRPSFVDAGSDRKVYSICNRADLLLGHFLTIPDGQNDAPVGDYLVSLLGIDLAKPAPQMYKFIGWYVYLIQYLRLCGASPEITLFNTVEKNHIPVDMSIDMGNSRTCAVLFENADFTKAKMLRLRDMSRPWKSYENAFDMRVVFRRADFGGDITQGKDLFNYQSLVRVGEEAKHLIYNSRTEIESERATSCSSPKRYLWDEKPSPKGWEMLVMDDDPTNMQLNSQVFIEGFTNHFAKDGKYIPTPKPLDLTSLNFDDECNYSRGSLMTFVMIEILQQAISYINSSRFREMHGSINCYRYIRNIIITCPTAMPLQEQRSLRLAAVNAADLVHKLGKYEPHSDMKIIPSPENLVSTDDVQEREKRGWIYDEAFASQLVYLYAELAERYSGKVDKFFELKGHHRKDMDDKGFQGNSLTIGTIDIGAGTTDVMVTAFGEKGQGRLSPVPLYYDSFYTAGDDILRHIIRDVILEGQDSPVATMGSVGNALSARIHAMSPDDLLKIKRVADTPRLVSDVQDIRMAISEEDATKMRNHLTQELMNHFFSDDSSQLSEKDRRCRLDFCTQVSIPMAQFFLEQLKQERPVKVYTFADIFQKEQPSKDVLDHFEYTFGFRFEELSWKFDPEVIGGIVRDTMEPIVKAMSVIVYALNCDILVLSGRPSSLKPLTELFLKYIPISPNRLVLLNNYRVGHWFPLATGEGYFQESQKAVVAVGAQAGYLANTTGFRGLVLDFSYLGKEMKSTACYLGKFDGDLLTVPEPYLAPDKTSALLRGVAVFPYYIGCKQFNSPKYQARPIFAIYNHSSHPQLNILLQRNYHEDRELVSVEDVTDMDGETVPNSEVEVRLQTIAGDGQFWMDKGAFTLKIHEK